MADQWIRKASLLLVGDSQALDMSEMRFRFEVRQSDIQTPNTCFVRVYNLSDSTIQKIGKEFSRVIIQAGYESGNFGVVFDGTVKQFKHGKENSTDSYLDIIAGDGDVPYNFAILNTTLAAGATQKDVAQAISKSFNEKGAALAPDASGLIGGTDPAALARGKVMFGMSRDYMRDWSNKNGFRWSIQNGSLVVTPISGYRPGTAVVLNSVTGLIGVPEATESGINVRCLLNPLIRIGCLLQINNKDITTTNLLGQSDVNYAPQYAASVTDDGFYRVLVCEFTGDTRGQTWYCDIVCIAVDTSAVASESVAMSG